MGIATFRRYRQQKALEAARRGETGVAAAFKAKQEASPGTPLPADFVNAKVHEALTTAQPVAYSTYEDLNGASVDELVAINGIGRKTAEKILSLVEEWAAAQA